MNLTVEITLTWHEAAMASEIGRLRRLSSLRHNRQNQHGFSGEGWNIDIEGACGELAAAKALNIFWDGGIDTFKGYDLGELQVRTTPKHENSLIIRPSDPDNHRYVLVTGLCPFYKIHGWLLGSDAKKNCWAQSPAGRPVAYFVPSKELRPIAELLINLNS